MMFTTNEVEYSVVEFFEAFENSLPKIVKVSQGYCGEIIEDTFDKDQAIRLHTVCRQKRVVAETELHGEVKYFSIPVDYQNMKLCVVSKNGKVGKETDLEDIVKKEKNLPITVQFPKDKIITVGNTKIGTNCLPSLELTNLFDEISLVGNFINDGHMSPDVVQVPLYLSQLRLSVITGIAGQPKEDWEKYQLSLSKVAEKIEYKENFGNPEMAEYHRASIKETSDNLYSFITPRQYYNFLPLFADNKPEGQSRSTPTDENETDLVTNTKVLESKKPSHSTEDHAMIEPAEKDGNLFIDDKDGGSERKVAKKPSVAAKDKPFSKDHSVATASIALPQPVPTKPDLSLNKMQKRSHHCENDVTRGHVATIVNAVEKGTHTSPENVAAPSVLVGNGQPDTEGDVTGADHQIVAEIKEANSQSHLPTVSGPEDIARLTIDQVSEYLRILGLEAYSEEFRVQQMDGELLSEIDKDILKDDFRMKGIEAHRLMKFITKGHIPK